MPNFIDLNQIEAKTLRKIIETAKALKNKEISPTLPGANLAMIFDKSSTRTRISFETGINQLGGHAIVMNKSDTQLGKGETVYDTANVMSGYVDMVMLRVSDHNLITEFAQHASIPVINALSDFSHPCQIMASIMAIEETIGSVEGKTLAWFGDANNVLTSYIHGANAFGYELKIATPSNYDFCDQEIAKAVNQGAKISYYSNSQNPQRQIQSLGNIQDAALNADVVITDTWVSMGQEKDNDKLQELAPFQVNTDLMSHAKKDTIFTHCLPAYRGFEVEDKVIDSPNSIIFKEAHNRLHAQKAIMLWCCDAI